MKQHEESLIHPEKAATEDAVAKRIAIWLRATAGIPDHIPDAIERGAWRRVLLGVRKGGEP